MYIQCFVIRFSVRLTCIFLRLKEASRKSTSLRLVFMPMSNPIFKKKYDSFTGFARVCYDFLRLCDRLPCSCLYHR